MALQFKIEIEPFCELALQIRGHPHLESHRWQCWADIFVLLSKENLKECIMMTVAQKSIWVEDLVLQKIRYPSKSHKTEFPDSNISITFYLFLLFNSSHL